MTMFGSSINNQPKLQIWNRKSSTTKSSFLRVTIFVAAHSAREIQTTITATSIPVMEELEKACWDGMLQEMFPELFEKSVQRNNNYVWNTASGVNFLCVQMAPCPLPVEKETSIVPYYFLNTTGNAN